MSILEKINFRQPKYMLPAILYLPLLGASYFIFDLFRTEKAEVQDTTLQTTEFLNPELPEATLKNGDGIGSKYENMTKSWGRIQDYTAVDNIERDEPDENKEEYESKYTDDDIALLGEVEQEKSMAAEAADAKKREEEALAELEKALAEARLRGQQEVTPPAKEDTAQTEVPPVEPQAEGRIDEDIKAVDGSRVRLRLLDDVEIDGSTLRKGTYLYATVSGFSSGRVKGSISSILVGDKLVKVSLSLYDTDGLEGLYVPESQFRETSKDVASSAMSGNLSMNTGGYGNNLAQWGMQAVQNAYQKTSNAISKAIKKNKVKLKYGTFVYLVNGNQKQ